MKEEERLRVDEHEEEVHMMCEPKQGVYLEEEKEDADTGFADKLMKKENSSYQYTKENEDADTEFDDKLLNKANSSYQYTEENEDVDEKPIEDFKGCFEETNQHRRMEEKASAKAVVPYVFQTDNM